MFGSKNHAPGARFGLVIDVSSASVAAAIVVSEPQTESKVIWTHTERSPVSADFTIEDGTKRVVAAIVATALEINNTGLHALTSYNEQARIQHTQVSISAPWSYTTPKRITHSAEEGFEVTASMLRDLVSAAEDTLTKQYAQNEIFKEMGLEIIASDTQSYSANGYPTTNPIGKTVSELVVTLQQTVCQKKVLDAVAELHESVAANTDIVIRSYIEHMRLDIQTNTTSGSIYGLVDISGQATEIAVLANNELQQVVSSSWGYYSIARELADVTKQPPGSALDYLKTTTDGVTQAVNAAHSVDFVTIQQNYSNRLYQLLLRAAKDTELPSHYFIHTDTGLEVFAESALRQALSETGVTGYSISSANVAEDVSDLAEKRLRASIRVFHNQSR